MEWLCEWAGTMHRRYRISERDGRTAFHRCRGKSANRPIVEFGERVLAQELLADPSARRNMEPRFEEGIVIGLLEESDELVISTGKGLILSSSVKRRDPGSQWCGPAVMNVTMGPAEFKGYADARPHIPSTPADPMEPKPAADEDQTGPVPRSFRTSSQDYETFGYTQGCPGRANM